MENQMPPEIGRGGYNDRISFNFTDQFSFCFIFDKKTIIT